LLTCDRYFRSNFLVCLNRVLDHLDEILVDFNLADHAHFASNLGRHAGVAIDDPHHDLLGIVVADLVIMHQADKICQLLVTKNVFHDVHEVDIFLLAVAIDVLVDPMIRRK
jgi:hypothetical protein